MKVKTAVKAGLKASPILFKKGTNMKTRTSVKAGSGKATPILF